jgi:Protein of unknown function (DUF3294)
MNQNPPPVADPLANAFLVNAYGGGGNDARTRVGRAAKRANLTWELHRYGAVTTPEHGDQVIFVSALVAAAGNPAGNVAAVAVPPAAPAWAQQLINQNNVMANQVNSLTNQVNALTNQVNATNNQLNALTNQVNNMNNQLTTVTWHVININRRLANGTATEGTDPIQPLIDAAGAVPPNFPNTLGGLLALNANTAAGILVFYQLPANPRATRKTRLRKFLGARV